MLSFVRWINRKISILKLKWKIPQEIRKENPTNNLPIIPASVAIPFFGNIEKAEVATISINPSSLEFYDKQSKQRLTNKNKRLVDRVSLSAQNNNPLTLWQAMKVYRSLMKYFNNNPYRYWFDVLEHYVGKLFKCSYYKSKKKNLMVHLDIYPWATTKAWRNLTSTQKSNALNSYQLLKDILTEKDFKWIYINGRAVKNQIDTYFKGKIKWYTKHANKYPPYELFFGILRLNNKIIKLIGSSCYIQYYLRSHHSNRQAIAYLFNLHKAIKKRKKPLERLANKYKKKFK